MFDSLKKIFAAPPAEDSTSGKRDARVAACALILEMAEIDGEFSGEERDHILYLLRSEYGLSDAHAAELSRAAQAEREGSLDLWGFAKMINEHYDQAEKIQVVEMLWRVVYADDHVSEHEQYLVTRLRKVLRIPHRDLIDAKLRVLNEMDEKRDPD